MLQNRTVYIRLLQKDQYNRVVVQMFVKRGLFGFKRYFVDEHMLKAGLGEVYLGGGAVYGPLGKDRYLELQEIAQKEKVGIWSLKNRESAADYKRRTKS